MLDRWPPVAWAALAAVLAFALRAPFFGVPLTTDEGGYAEVARLWSRGWSLYDETWVDRPQGLLLVFRGILHLDGGSVTAFRVVAALVAVALVVLTMGVAARVMGRIPAILAGLLLSTLGVAPRLESFTVAGEMLAAVPAALTVLLFTFHLADRRRLWLVACGLLTGCAVMIKQSGFDGGLAVVAWLLITRRRAGIASALLVVGFAFVPVALGVLLSGNAHDWWYAVVSYRSQGDSILSGSPIDRVKLFWGTAPAAAISLAPLVALAALGWRSTPLLVRLWLGAAVLALIGGGNFHPHYYLQLLPPLAIVAGGGAAELLRRPRRPALAVVAALAALTIAGTIPLYLRSGAEQTHSLFPEDPHLPLSAPLAGWLRDNTGADEPVLMLWAAADVQYLADRDPPIPYLWYRNIQTIPGALGQLQHQLEPGGVRWVVVLHRPRKLDKSGTTSRLLYRNFHRVAMVDGVPIFERR
ncbi:MAG: ArnT family glycosyltransferase [Gaiellales bacterium]